MKKIAVGMITVNSLTHWGVTASWMNLVNYHAEGHDFEFIPIFRRGIYLDKLRNMVSLEFLQGTDCEALWFIDYDNGFNPESVDLFLDALDAGAEIITGAYYYRDQPWLVAGMESPISADRAYRKLAEIDLDPGLSDLTKMAMGKAMCGCGMLMISRNVFHKMEFPWFQTKWFMGFDGRYAHMSEDVFFCEEAQEKGIHIYMDKRIQSPHMSGEICYPPEWKPYT